jgi:hypothetical protein
LMIDFDGSVRFGRKDAHEYAYSEQRLDFGRFVSHYDIITQGCERI